MDHTSLAESEADHRLLRPIRLLRLILIQAKTLQEDYPWSAREQERNLALAKGK